MEKRNNMHGFMSIRNRFLIFSLLATLVPSFGMGFLLNSMMHTTITEKIEQKLLDSASIVDREISLWFKERVYDLRVFSNSFVMAENLTKYLNDMGGNPARIANEKIYINDLANYLTSVRNQFEYYTCLIVLDNEGRIVTTSDTVGEELPVNMPGDAANQIENAGYFIGEVYFKAGNQSPFMLIGIPLFIEKHKQSIGTLAVELRLEGLLPILQRNLLKKTADSPVNGTLVRLSDYRPFLSLGNFKDHVPSESIAQHITQSFSAPSGIHDFTNKQGARVVGVVESLAILNWGLVITESYDDVYANLIRSRNRNLVIVLSVAVIIGLAAYHFSTRIIQPITTLTKGAQRVAEGDLGVQLPVFLNDELGLTTKVFNEMVVELHQSHEKLKELATIDSLTQLANRMRIMEILVSHFEHFQRYKKEFSILMIDVDHFKEINDTYGHLAGDALLRQFARIFQETLRNVDISGRYGGEEFLVILPETNGEEARKSAERIRETVKKHVFLYDGQTLKISVSIGLATVQSQDKDEDSLISRADNALYKAKNSGRDRVGVW